METRGLMLLIVIYVFQVIYCVIGLLFLRFEKKFLPEDFKVLKYICGFGLGSLAIVSPRLHPGMSRRTRKRLSRLIWRL